MIGYMYSLLGKFLVSMICLCALQGCADREAIKAQEVEVQKLQVKIEEADAKLASIMADYAEAEIKEAEIKRKLGQAEKEHPKGISRSDVLKIKEELAAQIEQNKLIQEELNKL